MRQRDFFDLAVAVAREQGTTLARIVSRSHDADSVRGRRELWSRLYEIVGNYSSVARIWETDPSTVICALRDPPRIVQVKLAEQGDRELWWFNQKDPFVVFERGEPVEFFAELREAQAFVARRSSEAT